MPRRARVEAFTRDGECLLYNSTRDEATALNRTAAEVWELCDGSLTTSDIARLLGGRYGVDGGMLFADVADLLLTLRARGLVEFVDRPPTTAT